MKILHVGKYYPPVPGGMERVLQLLCEGERREVDSRVLVASTGRDHVSRGAERRADHACRQPRDDWQRRAVAGAAVGAPRGAVPT